MTGSARHYSAYKRGTEALCHQAGARGQLESNGIPASESSPNPWRLGPCFAQLRLASWHDEQSHAALLTSAAAFLTANQLFLKHSTAQHSTAQHSIAQHGTAQSVATSYLIQACDPVRIPQGVLHHTHTSNMLRTQHQHVTAEAMTCMLHHNLLQDKYAWHVSMPTKHCKSVRKTPADV